MTKIPTPADVHGLLNKDVVQQAVVDHVANFTSRKLQDADWLRDNLHRGSVSGDYYMLHFSTSDTRINVNTADAIKRLFELAGWHANAELNNGGQTMDLMLYAHMLLVPEPTLSPDAPVEASHEHA